VQLRGGDEVGVGPGREVRVAAPSSARLTVLLAGGPTKERGVLGKDDAAAVFDLDVDRPEQVFRLRHEVSDVLGERVPPNCFLAGFAECHVLRLHCGQSHHILHHGGSADGRFAKDDDEERHGSLRLVLTFPVLIAKVLAHFASTLDRATMFCIKEAQLTAALSRMQMTGVVDLRVS